MGEVGLHSCLLEKATGGPNVGRGRIARSIHKAEEGEVNLS